MPKQMTIRGVSEELAERLRRIALDRKESVNRAVLRILEQAAGLDPKRRRLSRYATWNEKDAEEFDWALREQRRVDDDAWR
jgi:hypothetical protein